MNTGETFSKFPELLVEVPTFWCVHTAGIRNVGCLVIGTLFGGIILAPTSEKGVKQF